MATGWTWDEVETQMTLPRLKALGRAWRRHPPSHLLLAAWLGYKAPAGPRGREGEPRGDLAELAAFIGMR